jgi:hypothetical protein
MLSNNGKLIKNLEINFLILWFFFF